MPLNRRTRVLMAGCAALALGAGALIGASSALSITGIEAECSPVTPESYVNDPRTGTTDNGPAGTEANPYVPGVTVLCSSADGDAWAISLGSVAVTEADHSASINGGVTYLGTDAGTPSRDIRVVVQDSGSTSHVAQLDSPADLAPMETVAVTAHVADIGDDAPTSIEVHVTGGESFFYAV
ncbi:hypothetical protein [Herbiconiux flava]|uniref:Secreted protein n=1 Tax=Herbiconiux flava TaxID=881268 RepID=A0A852SI56_9MICO|nr:hypothetical protein [Herbiconiux flava]NYD68920.1 hypothetical protein [Herbiconiux flava]